MKNTILYLFIFSLLINIFQYVNSNKILDAKEKQIVDTKRHLKISRDSLRLMSENNSFDLKNNDNAQEYFYNKGIDFNKVIEKVNNDINALNATKGGNPLIPYDMIDGKPFLVNRIKMVNHRWVIAEYSNGKIWGEVLLKYFIVEDKPTEFETIDTVLFEATL
ncbi:hydrolase [uncultured Flavobacterium sp.]|uniref:hydrolase n=1 Tax=uncultured Flavobacterium sp. TaxID=165435 RepID=UPI0030C7D5DE